MSCAQMVNSVKEVATRFYQTVKSRRMRSW